MIDEDNPKVMQDPSTDHKELGGFEITMEPERSVQQHPMGIDMGGNGLEDCYENGNTAETYPVGNSSAAGAVANFVNTIVGAGIVGLPFALAQVRLVGGVLGFDGEKLANKTSS